MNCIFCHERPGGRSLTKEHVFSKPVRQAFGILDDTHIGRIGDEGVVSSFTRADQFQVRLPCASCNNGWMSSLEVDFARTVTSWKRGRNRLGKHRARTIEQWLLKTYIVLGAAEAQTRDVGAVGETPPWRVMPEATRARQLFEGDDAAFAGTRVGASQITSSRRLYGFGNPAIESPHGGLAPHISAGACFITLENRRLWIVVAFDTEATIHLPPGVSGLTPHVRPGSLNYVSDSADFTKVRVLNSPGFDQTKNALKNLT